VFAIANDNHRRCDRIATRCPTPATPRSGRVSLSPGATPQPISPLETFRLGDHLLVLTLAVTLHLAETAYHVLCSRSTASGLTTGREL
jgi:hypothetical protein